MTFLFSGPNGDRTKKAFMAGLVGLLVNLMLGVFKILAGWQSGFLSVMGDGFNNITDMGSVVLLMMTFYYAAKPSDKEHPFGHGRLEYINSTVMAAVILFWWNRYRRLFIPEIRNLLFLSPLFLSLAFWPNCFWPGGIKGQGRR